MKEYRLLAWPELTAEHRRTAYRRILSEMSLRFVTFTQLVDCSGLRKGEVRAFVEMLDGRGLVSEQDSAAPDTFLDSFSPLAWFRRAISVDHDGR